MLRGGGGFFWDQSRCAAVAFASGEREGASMAVINGCRFRFMIASSQEDECV